MKFVRDWDRSLQLLIVNEEFLVRTSHHLVLIMSLPFVHTARRYYRLSGSVRASDWSRSGTQVPAPLAEKKLELDRLEKVKVVTRFP